MADTLPDSPHAVQNSSEPNGKILSSESDSDLEDVAVKFLTKALTSTSIAD